MPSSLHDVETPFLAVDLDRLEANIQRMRRTIIDRGKVAWRPHVKAIKTPAIAHKLIASGAAGVTCAKLSEAEVMAYAGIKDILIANEIVVPSKIDRLVRLNRHATVIAAVDMVDNARAISQAGEAAGVRVPLVVEVDIGLNRAGVEPGAPVAEFASSLASLPGVRFLGLMAWEGHATAIPDRAKKEAEIRRSVAKLVSSADLCRDAGVPVEIVSCGGTGTYWITSQIPGVTEIQAGGGIFCDVRYKTEFGVEHDYALTLWTTVISRPRSTRLVCDAGWKAMGRHPTLPQPLGIGPLSRMAMSAEHTTVEFAEGTAAPGVGDRLQFVVGYSDSTVFLHDYLHGIRGEMVETVWPLLARGKLV